MFLFPNDTFSGNGGSNDYHQARFQMNGWCTSGTESNQYLLINLQREYHITRVVTMGDKNQTSWSDSYLLRYSRKKAFIHSGTKDVEMVRTCSGKASTTI